MDSVIDPGRSAKWRIMGVLMQSESAVERVQSYVDEMDFFGSLIRRDLGELWKILSNYVHKYNAIPSLDIYITGLEFELDDIQDVNREFNFETTVNNVEQILDQESPSQDTVDFYVDCILDIYKQWTSQAMAKESEQGNWDTVEELLRKGQTVDQNEEKFYAHPFSGDPAEYTNSGPREPTGVPPIDQLTSGGPQEGESMLFVMPTNTGKTTLAVQLSEALVRNQVPHLYISLEQTAKGDLAKRLYIRATRTTREYWEDEDAEMVFQKYPWIRDRFEANKDEWDKYLKLMDGWAKPRTKLSSISELFAPVYKWRDEHGVYIKHLILDWWGEACDRIIATRNIKSDNAIEVKKSLAGQISTYTEQAVEDEIPLRTTVFHQVSGAVAEHSKPSRPITVQAASGDKDLANKFQYAVAATKLDPDSKITCMNADKTRQGEGGLMEFKLYGNECYFDYPSADEKQHMNQQRQNSQRTGGRRGRSVKA